MKTKTVSINGKQVEAVWVEKQGDWKAHWEVNGEPFEGHHVLWSFLYEPQTYLKESELSGDEWRKGGSIKIFCDGVCVLNDFCREPDRAAIVVHQKLEACMGTNWENIVIGRKIYYKDYPCFIERILEEGELILKTEDGSDFPLWAFEQENAKENGEDKYRDWTDTTKVHATDRNIYWWRS